MFYMPSCHILGQTVLSHITTEQRKLAHMRNNVLAHITEVSGCLATRKHTRALRSLSLSLLPSVDAVSDRGRMLASWVEGC